jgi:hypothetical protein
MNRLTWSGASLAGTLALGACSSSAPGTPVDAGLPQCSVHEDAAAVPNSMGFGFAYAALPAGQCSGASCTLPAFGPCGNPDYVGYPVNQFECDCDDSHWNCRVIVQGGALCAGADGSVPGDATADAATGSE